MSYVKEEAKRWGKREKDAFKNTKSENLHIVEIAMLRTFQLSSSAELLG